MCNINCQIEDGLIPSEKVARLATADGGFEEVVVSAAQTTGSKLMAFEVGRTEGKVLVELPRESSSGRWRVWVREQDIG
jgi:hypothetical protein